MKFVLSKLCQLLQLVIGPSLQCNYKCHSLFTIIHMNFEIGLNDQEAKLSNTIKLQQKETYKDLEASDFWKLKQKTKWEQNWQLFQWVQH